MSTKSLLCVWTYILVLGVIAAGCGGKPEALNEVTGRVTVDEQPAAGLEVLFEPKDQTKPSSLGFTQADGTYRLTTAAGQPGAVQGTHIVRVTAQERDEGPALVIPDRYNVASELTCDVTSGSTTYDIEITSR